ncbi:MAG: OmpH family outer membrane protein [Polyangiaceae bacterium]|nr:OmpH family outer membrane protein [Polyangiaceae bacterium]
MIIQKLRYLLMLCIASLVLLSAPIAAAQIKIAVVDMQRAVMETEDGLRAQATLKKLFDRKQSDLDARQEELKRARDDIEKQARVLSKDALDRRRAEWEQSMAELQNMFVEFNKELQKEERRLTQPIITRVQSVLRQLAAQEGYDAILERAAVPYVRTDLDITDRVIQRYNAGGAGGSAPAAPPAEPPKPPPAAPKPN